MVTKLHAYELETQREDQQTRADTLERSLRLLNEQYAVLNEALTSERQRRGEAEAALREWEREADNHSSWTDNPTARYFRKYEPIPADREEERGG